MSAAPRDKQGSAAGFLSTGRVVGQSVSVALAGAIFGSLGGATAGRALSSSAQTLSSAQQVYLQHTFTTAFHATFLVCALIAGIGVLTSLVRGKEQPNRRRH